MSESISSRVARVLAGGVQKIVEAVEKAAPETVLEQTIREIDSAAEEVRAQLGREIASKHLATKRLFEANKKHDELREQTAIALNEGREDLAEAAIARQLDIEAQIPVIEESINDLTEREKQLEGYLRALHGRVREMKEELASYRSQKERSAAVKESSLAGTDTSEVGTRVRRAEAAFDRLLEKITGVPVGSGNVEVSANAKLQELEQLTRTNRIKERLAATKAALGREE